MFNPFSTGWVISSKDNKCSFLFVGGGHKTVSQRNPKSLQGEKPNKSQVRICFKQLLNIGNNSKLLMQQHKVLKNRIDRQF